jgi:hypothetical protein
MRGHEGGRRELGATLYPIDGLDGADMQFRVLRVRESMPQDNLQAKRLQRMADQLWRGMLKTAVAPTQRFGYPGFLVLESRRLVPGTAYEILDVPDRRYHIEVTEQLHVIAPQSARGAERDLLCRTLERAFTDRLVALPDEFWHETWTTFYLREADNEHVASDRVRAFRGLRFGVLILDGRPFLAADVRTRYLGRISLTNASSQEQTLLRFHLDEQIRPEARALFVRDNGARKHACRYCGETDQTVGTYTFEANGRRQTVYEYYRDRFPSLGVPPTDRAVFVQDRKGGLVLAVPASRLFPVFTTEDEAIRCCSIQPQLAPAERLRLIERVLSRFARTPFGAQYLTPSTVPWRGRRTVFPPPALEFGGQTILSPFAGRVTPQASHDQFDRAVLSFGGRKVQSVESAPPFHNEPLPDVVLFYPDGFPREAREALISILGESVRRVSDQALRVRQQVGYAVGHGEREGGDLLRRVAPTLDAFGAGLALVILGRELNPDVHGALKEALRASHSQCISEIKARDIAAGHASGQMASLVRNLSLAVLTEVGVMPWVLAEPLHHDLHLGIDLLYGRIGYHALYGRGGRYVSSDFGTALHDGHMREQIKRPELRQRSEAILRAVAASGEPLRSLVVHRDGRWWPSESDGLRDAVTGLIGSGVLPADFRYAVVEVRKNHLPVRLFTIVDQERGEGLVNPLPGSYRVLDAERALLATTGRPGGWDGRRGRTASTLLLEVVDSHGHFGLERIVEDAYRLTHLNWNAPEIEIAHPVTIRWTDRALREPLRGTRTRHGASAEEVA